MPQANRSKRILRWRSAFTVSMWLGLVAVPQAFAPMLIAVKGIVVNVSSVGSLSEIPWGGI